VPVIATRARVTLAFACVAVVAVAASCGSDGNVTETEPTSRIDLVVGDIVPLTGPGAALGVSAQKAAQLAVEEINDAIAEADVEHTVEIVHEDGSTLGARGAADSLRERGTSCVLGPWSGRGIAKAARALDSPRGGLLISPQVEFAYAGPPDRQPVVGLPALGPQETLSPENKDPDRDDPTAAFARLYTSSDPPISPALRTDARQFDAVIACYLAAVAAGEASGARMSGRIAGPGGGPVFSWLQLADAIEALENGRPLEYRGLTATVGIAP
jgi:hypothetical protein